jgi:hypothetical protein
MMKGEVFFRCWYLQPSLQFVVKARSQPLSGTPQRRFTVNIRLG